MTMHKALHPRNDVDIQYVSRKKEGRGLAIIEDSVHGSIQLDTTRGVHRKTRRRTYYRHQKLYRQHGDQRNENNLETKWEESNSLGVLND